MKTISLLAALLLSGNLCAAPSLEDAFSQASLAARQLRADLALPAAAAARLPVRETYADVNACWERPAQEAADALGLPRRFCIKRAGVAVPGDWDLPFADEGALIVEGEPASGRLHVSGGSRQTDGWNIVGDLWSKQKDMVCGQLNMAFAAVYVGIDFKGRILPTRPVVRGFLMDGSALCPAPAKSVEILYTPVP